MAATVDVEAPAADRVWTIPNLLSMLRLLGVPLFLWLALGPHADGWAFAVLAFAGVSDYADGKIERRLRETFGFAGSPIELSVRVREKRRR